MKNTSRKPYIYKVTNLENHQYYIGSQCSGKKIGVNYFTSSTNKAFKEGFKTYGGEKYKIEIIKEFEDPEKCVRAENYIIRNWMQLKDGLCLNRFYCCGGKKIFSRVGTHHSEETRQKISKTLKGTHLPEETKQKMSRAKKGRPFPHKGIPHSEKTKQKISRVLKGRQAWNKGTHHSEEAKQKMSETHKGIHHSEGTKEKMSKAKKGTHPSEGTKQKISTALKRKISIKNTVFDSLTEAAKYYNVVPSTISYWIKNKNHNTIYAI